MDDTLATAAMLYRPPGHWSVSTELTLNFLRPLPSDGSVITASATGLSIDAEGAFAQGSAHDADGRVLVHATTWLKLVPEVPESIERQQPAAPLASPPGSLQQLLNAQAGSGHNALIIPANEDFTNPHGTVHGGIMTTIAEYAASRVLSGPGPLALESIHASFVRPGVGPLTVVCSVRHGGRSLQVVDVEVRRNSGKPAVLATVVYRADPLAR